MNKQRTDLGNSVLQGRGAISYIIHRTIIAFNVIYGYLYSHIVLPPAKAVTHCFCNDVSPFINNVMLILISILIM